MKKMILVKTLISILPFMVVGFSTVYADTIDLNLGVPNAAISGFTGPYALVTVTTTGASTADVSLTSLSSGGNIYLFGDGSTIALNTNGTVTASLIAGTNSGTGFSSPGPFTTDVSGKQVDGFGNFNFLINNFNGFAHSVDSLTFTLTDTSGTWASAADVLTANPNGYEAADHVFVTSSPANLSNGALATGYAANGPSPVSIPASQILFGSGLVGLGTWGRKLLKRI